MRTKRGANGSGGKDKDSDLQKLLSSADDFLSSEEDGEQEEETTGDSSNTSATLDTSGHRYERDVYMQSFRS